MKMTREITTNMEERVTDLDDAFHHAHHLVDDGDDFMRPLRRGHVGPVRGRQDVAAGHVQDVGGRQLEVDRGAVGVVDDGRQEGVLRWRSGVRFYHQIKSRRLRFTSSCLVVRDATDIYFGH